MIVYQNILGLELRNKKPREVFRAQEFSLARCMCGELSQLRNQPNLIWDTLIDIYKVFFNANK